jgi:hypothetical protein
MRPTQLHRHSNTNDRCRMRSRTRSLLALSLLGSLAAAAPAHAGATLKIGEDASIGIGIGLRTSFTRIEDAAPNGSSWSNDFAVENARIFLNGQWGRYVKATLNTERRGGPAVVDGDDVRIMDAIAQFEFSDLFNVWLGRMLPPSDRANLSGPFYVLPWSYPGVVSNYPNIAVGRDNGAMVWGRPFGGKVVYSVGLFNGHNNVGGLSNQSDKLLVAGRLHVNLLDVEPPPAHYLGSTYYGSNDILSIGIAGNTQAKGVGTAEDPGRLRIWNVDLLFEKKLPGGFVPTLEGAYYRYKMGAVDCGSGEPGSVACPGGDNVGGQVDGKAYLVTAALLIPGKVGWGQFQPFVRYQKYKRDVSDTTSKATDVGINYVINGANAKVSLMYTRFDDSRLAPAETKTKQVVLGVQLQF